MKTSVLQRENLEGGVAHIGRWVGIHIICPFNIYSRHMTTIFGCQKAGQMGEEKRVRNMSRFEPHSLEVGEVGARIVRY